VLEALQEEDCRVAVERIAGPTGLWSTEAMSVVLRASCGLTFDDIIAA